VSTTDEDGVQSAAKGLISKLGSAVEAAGREARRAQLLRSFLSIVHIVSLSVAVAEASIITFYAGGALSWMLPLQITLCIAVFSYSVSVSVVPERTVRFNVEKYQKLSRLYLEASMELLPENKDQRSLDARLYEIYARAHQITMDTDSLATRTGTSR